MYVVRWGSSEEEGCVLGVGDIMYFVGWGSSSEEGCVGRGGGHHVFRGQF